MKHKNLTKFIILVVLSLSVGGLYVTAGAQPNVIVFLVDDMGWMDSGVYGSKYYETPRMDRFAQQAMRFTDAYAQPLCSPTRASLLTGKYSARHGITSATGHRPPQPAGYKFLPESAPVTQPMLLPDSKNFLDPTEYTLAEALRAAGYRTAHIGKWHLGLTPPHWPEQQGFDVAFHCHPDPGPPGNYFSPYGVVPEGEPTGKLRVGNITDGPEGEYIVDRLADEAVRFIEANRGRPFFLNLWNYGVHGPWGHKEAYTKQFAGKKDPRGVQGNPIMASMLRSVDECFGRVLDTLEKHKLMENTIVIFNSDNGGNTHSNMSEDGKTKKRKTDDPLLADWRKWAGNQPPTINTPLRDGKGTLYEGGTRVSLMWCWPGHIKPGTLSDAVVGHIDLYPTLLDLLGLPKPQQQKWDGVSYASVLRQTGALERKAFFNYFPHAGNGRAGGVWVRAGDWKLIRWFGLLPGDAGRYELYNLRNDVSETKNLAVTEPARVKELDALIDGFLQGTGATYPCPNPAYKPAQAAAKAQAARPLGGWVPKGCKAEERNGALVVTGEGKNPFLGITNLKHEGPVLLRLQAKSAGGAAKIQWRSADQEQFPGSGQTADFTLAASREGTETQVEFPVKGTLQHLRLYLPSQTQPVELDWVELRSTNANAKPQRWEF
jgi:arylsulfatase A-like enzyme